MTKEQIKEEMEVGDYALAAKMLRTSRDSARMRFFRNKKDVISALKKIIDNRNELIKEYHLNN